MNLFLLGGASSPRTIVLDFDGGAQLYRNAELGVEIPMYVTPSGIDDARRKQLAAALRREGFDVAPTGGRTIRVGRTDAFDRFGRFAGLAEGIGAGDAFVFLDDSASDAELLSVIRHEAGHILGTLDHGGTGLARYALFTHEHKKWELQGRGPDNWIIYQDESRIGEPYLFRKTTTTVMYHVQPVPVEMGIVNNISLVAEVGYVATEYLYDFECKLLDAFTGFYWDRYDTEYIEETKEYDYYYEASGIKALGTISIYGGKADNCTAKNIEVRGYLSGYDEKTEGDQNYHVDKKYGYTWAQGDATGCKATGKITVYGRAVALDCQAQHLVVGDSLEYYGEDGGPSRYVSGRAVNCCVSSLTVEPGGVVQNIRVGGYADIGLKANTPEEKAKVDATIAEHGTAKVTNFYYNTANKRGGSGSLYAYRGAEVTNVDTKGGIFAREGAILKGSLTCGSVDLQGVVPQSNITIKLDLRDHASANYREDFYDINGAVVKTVEYFANYTTRTTLYGKDEDGYSTYTYSYGTFDNSDGRFDMRDWKYTFSAYLGTVDALALPYITVDFGGTESEFSGGSVTFDYPSTTREIQFVMNSDKQKWSEVWEDYWGNDLGEYQGWLVYDPTLHGDAAEVLWLEYGDDEEVEYTVALPSGIMGGATIDASVDGGVGGDAELKGSTLVVKGSVDTGDVTVTAKDKENVQHECELELIVVPETIPVIGKAGAESYSQLLKKMQKDRISKASTILPNDIETRLFGMKFCLSNMGMTLTVNWTKKEMELKLQGKMDWEIGKGDNKNLTLDLSGDNYISVTHNGKKLDWDFVGELKVPDFKIGKFGFSNMFLSVNKGESSFGMGGYVQLPGLDYKFGGSIGIVNGYMDSMSIGVDNLNVMLGTTGLMLQSISGSIDGIATSLDMTFGGDMGFTYGPKISVEWDCDWLGIEDGEYSLLEIGLGATISTSGEITGSASLSSLGGFITGSGTVLAAWGFFSIDGNFSLLNGCISIAGELNAGSGGVVISGTGTMSVPRNKYFGPLAGMGLSVNAKADFGSRYVMAWENMVIFGNNYTVGIKCTFDGDVDLLGSSDLLGGDSDLADASGLQTLRGFAADGESDQAAPPSASRMFFVTDYGTSLFQVKFSVSASTASASITYNGVEYTQAAIAAGLYGNMQIVNELTGTDCITIAVSNASLGEWTVNAYGDAGASFGAYTIAEAVENPVITAVTAGADQRSATIGYTLGDLSALENATVSIFRTAGNAVEHNGALVGEFSAAEATGSFQYVMTDDNIPGGSCAFYLMVSSDNLAPVYSDFSSAVDFITIDTEAPDQIQKVGAEWRSSGSTLTWEAPYDNIGVAGYKISYRASEEDEWTEADVTTTSFTFGAMPNGIYAYRVAAYDAEGNIAAWSVGESVLVNLAANATHKNAALTEDTVLAEFEGAVGVNAENVMLTAAENSLIADSTVGNAAIRGIVDNTVFNGEAELFAGAHGRDFTVSGKLNVGVGTGEETEVLNPFVDEIPEKVIDTTNPATAENVSVVSGGNLAVGNSGRANGVTVSAGGALALVGNAEFSDVTVGYGATLTIAGNGRYDLTDDIRIAGKLNAGRNIYGSGHKIRFEQYKQTAEFQDFLDDVAFVSDMDKLVGDVLEVEIDSEAYGEYKIADTANYFDGTITVVSHNDSSSAAVGLGKFTLVGNALCRLSNYNDYNRRGLYLEVVRSQIGAPTLSVENAENDYEDTISVSATPAYGTGEVAQYTFRYSLNADMSDAVIVTPRKNTFTIAKDELTANATYYMQASVENTNGVQSLWSEAQSFTVIPKLDRPPAPTITVLYADSQYWDYIYISSMASWDTSPRQYSYRYSLNADMSDAVEVYPQQWYSNINIAKADLVANATYYIQSRLENTDGILGDWGNMTSFTVVPVSGVPDAPANLTVTEVAGGTVGSFRAEVDRDDANRDISGYRFRYADNPEMENAITVSADYANFADIDRAKLEDGQDYFFQAAVRWGTEWSGWTDTVSVRNVLGWNYENITVDAAGPYAYLTLEGRRARNVTVVEGGYFYGGGRVDGITVDGGFFRDDGGLVTNAVVNRGSYWLYGGSVSDIQVNAGEFRLYDGSLDGAFIGADATAEIVGTYTPTVSGTILIQGQMNVAYYNPGVTTDASFVFDLGSHEAAKDKMFIDYAGLFLGSRTFTVKLDDTPETGDYRLSYIPNSGDYDANLAAADGSGLGVMSLGGEAIKYNDLYYSLIGYNDAVYLHVSASDEPVFLGKVKLAKGGTVYASEDSYRDLTVSAASECDSVLVEAGGRIYTVTIGDGGAVDIYGELLGATVENGGRLTMNAGGLFTGNPVTIMKGGEVVVNGGSIQQGAKFQIAGTLTVNGALQSYENDSDSYYATYHEFNFALDQFDAPNTSVLINDYELLKTCSASFSVSVSANPAEGEYQLMGNAASYAFGITLYTEGGSSSGDYIWFGGNGSEINGRNYALSVKNDVLTLTIGSVIPDDPIIESDVIARTQMWDQPSDSGSYVVEYSSDNFEHAARITVYDTALDSYAAPAGCQWRVRPADSGEWTEPDTVYGAPMDDEPKFVRSNDDGVDDVFFARANGTWNGGYQAQHVGSLDSEWEGTGEQVGLTGKNRLGDLFDGSYDANVLLLTDDANGDALFVDDIYTALPGSVAEQQARIAQINEIRAGAGDDIVDMTSQRFEYFGEELTIRGGDGDDTIWAAGYSNYLFGDAGNDRIVGGFGLDFIAGGSGNDSMHGGGGRDVFTFGANWGNDIVEQLADEESQVMLWFAEGDHANWNASTLTYTDGNNSVTVRGVTADQIEIYIGDEFPWNFDMMSELGIFADVTSEKVFEEKAKGLLA